MRIQRAQMPRSCASNTGENYHLSVSQNSHRYRAAANNLNIKRTSYAAKQAQLDFAKSQLRTDELSQKSMKTMAATLQAKKKVLESQLVTTLE